MATRITRLQGFMSKPSNVFKRWKVFPCGATIDLWGGTLQKTFHLLNTLLGYET